MFARFELPRLMLVLGLWVAASCSHVSTLTQSERRMLCDRYVGKVFEVRHTSVIGDLYDDNERELLSPYPFEDVFHQVDLMGVPMHPAHPRALVPAGTAVRIVAIDHPTHGFWLKRMLATPTDSIWLTLEILSPHATGTAFARPPLILPILSHAAGVPAFDTAVARYLAPQGEVSRWLLARKPAIQVAIAHKEAILGMSREELETALGPAWRWFNDTLPDGTALRIAWYPRHEWWLHHEVVQATRPSRLVLH